MNEFYYARLSLKGHWSILHNSLPALRLWSRESPYKIFLHLRQILVTHMFARSRVLLVASELEVHPSKCLVSYLRRLKRGLLWNEGAWWVSRVEGAIRGGEGGGGLGGWGGGWGGGWVSLLWVVGWLYFSIQSSCRYGELNCRTNCV